MGALLEFLPSVYFHILKLELNTYTERKKKAEKKKNKTEINIFSLQFLPTHNPH